MAISTRVAYCSKSCAASLGVEVNVCVLVCGVVFARKRREDIFVEHDFLGMF